MAVGLERAGGPHGTAGFAVLTDGRVLATYGSADDDRILLATDKGELRPIHPRQIQASDLAIVLHRHNLSM